MPNMLKTIKIRQKIPKRSLRVSRAAAQKNLTRAFATFTQAAGSLEKSYLQLQAEVARLHQELRNANAELGKTLEENARVRAYLSRVLESLPCGILVVNAKAQTQIINPEARRLLGVPGDWTPNKENPLPPALQKLFEKVPENNFFSEQEWLASETPCNRSIGILRVNVSELTDEPGDTIWIVRDITEQQRLASERESGQRSRALAEVAAVLAHEIRNPSGSMELFAGLISSLDALASGLANSVNTQNQAGVDLNGAAGGNIFVPPPANGVGAASTLSLAITDPAKIAASAGPPPGNPGDNANALLALQNQNIINGQTPLNSYAGLVYKIGNDVCSAVSNQQAGGLVLQQLQNLQGGVSGVDINEEAANLVRYQNAYTAAAQVSSVVDSLLLTTINMVTP